MKVRPLFFKGISPSVPGHLEDQVPVRGIENYPTDSKLQEDTRAIELKLQEDLEKLRKERHTIDGKAPLTIKTVGKIALTGLLLAGGIVPLLIGGLPLLGLTVIPFLLALVPAAFAVKDFADAVKEHQVKNNKIKNRTLGAEKEIIELHDKYKEDHTKGVANKAVQTVPQPVDRGTQTIPRSVRDAAVQTERPRREVSAPPAPTAPPRYVVRTQTFGDGSSRQGGPGTGSQESGSTTLPSGGTTPPPSRGTTPPPSGGTTPPSSRGNTPPPSGRATEDSQGGGDGRVPFQQPAPSWPSESPLQRGGGGDGSGSDSSVPGRSTVTPAGSSSRSASPEPVVAPEGGEQGGDAPLPPPPPPPPPTTGSESPEPSAPAIPGAHRHAREWDDDDGSLVETPTRREGRRGGGGDGTLSRLRAAAVVTTPSRPQGSTMLGSPAGMHHKAVGTAFGSGLAARAIAMDKKEVFEVGETDCTLGLSEVRCRRKVEERRSKTGKFLGHTITYYQEGKLLPSLTQKTNKEHCFIGEDGKKIKEHDVNANALRRKQDETLALTSAEQARVSSLVKSLRSPGNGLGSPAGMTSPRGRVVGTYAQIGDDRGGPDAVARVLFPRSGSGLAAPPVVVGRGEAGLGRPMARTAAAPAASSALAPGAPSISAARAAGVEASLLAAGADRQTAATAKAVSSRPQPGSALAQAVRGGGRGAGGARGRPTALGVPGFGKAGRDTEGGMKF